jgi:hypothetical protein
VKDLDLEDLENALLVLDRQQITLLMASVADISRIRQAVAAHRKAESAEAKKHRWAAAEKSFYVFPGDHDHDHE